MNLNLGDTRLIIDACQKASLLRNQAAYVLATAYWETARTMNPVREYGGEAYLRSKKYYPFVGMGYVQLTWERNYRDWSKRLGVDFIANPKLLLKSEYAVRVIVDGMRLGTFTGKKLADYITIAKSDFTNARRIVNGTDKAASIASIALDYDADLKAIGYGELATPKPATPAAKTNWLAALIAAILSIFRKKADVR
ncbi:carboxypeptidase [Mesorhizobium sp.]|uniref:carboxypeptidase n=1 Tax=Mesorhizobium sp. TaxID=1871066 RepID=UPI00121594E3|nr:carboxypeptidase [Mesorhizobium sp.]TIN10375.1 MAG: carboxypeptidase [Mesorhizobium sp.]